ncbi:MAG: alpha-isopropylmalate synthase regulatory domain-containing protein, partial [Rhodospirillales bacterium]
GKEVSSDRLWQCFSDEYLKGEGAMAFVEHETWPDTRAGRGRLLRSTVCVDGADRTIEGHGTGPIDAFVDALGDAFGIDIEVVDYSEHAIGKGADAAAVAYVEARMPDGGSLFGVGIDKNIVAASLQAVVSAVNRGHQRGSIELPS